MTSEAAVLDVTAECSMYLSDSDQEESETEGESVSFEALNSFLVTTGKEPSPCTLQVPWQTASKKTRAFYVSKVKEIISEAVRVLAPKDAESLLQATLNCITTEDMDDQTMSANTDVLMTLIESYNELSDPENRRQILSIIADKLSFKRLQELIPGINQYQVTQAKKHKEQFGRGAAAPASTCQPRERVDSSKVVHFLDFVTSSNVIQDLPFGTKNIKLSCGKTVEIPNVIRLMIPSRVVEQYIAFCEERDFVPLGKRTLLRLLSNSCAASVQKSLQGLDYYVADGGKAFDDLLTVVDALESVQGLDTIEACHLRESLKQGKQYLKGDYKVIAVLTVRVTGKIPGYVVVWKN